jgi:hypothetical protein
MAELKSLVAQMIASEKATALKHHSIDKVNQSMEKSMSSDIRSFSDAKVKGVMKFKSKYQDIKPKVVTHR